MRVTLVAPVVTGAMGQSVDLLAAALAEHVEVTLVVPRHYHADQFRCNIVRLHSPERRSLRAGWWYEPFSQMQALAQVKATRPDVVHVFNGQGYLLPMLLSSALSRTPLVVTVHDPVAHGGSYADTLIYELGRRFVLPRTQAVHALSSYAAGMLQGQGVSSSKLVITRHGTLERLFTRHNDPEVRREDVSLFFGRWETYKGIDLLVDAVIELAQAGSVHRCILAGPGRVPAEVYQRIHAHPELFEVHNRYLTDAEVARLFQRSSRSILPYRDATQSSLPAIAQAYGHAVLATAVGSFAEEVHALGGICVQPGSVPALKQGLLRLQQLAPSSSSIDYSWQSVAQTLVNRYEQLHLSASMYTTPSCLLETET